MTTKHPPGPPMTLGNMRSLRVYHLIGYWHDDGVPARLDFGFDIPS
jgi:hypothetical protein